MSENTLSLTLGDIKTEIARYLGMALTAALRSANDDSMVDMIAKRGLSQYFNPPKIYENEDPHKWSFLEPLGSVSTIAPYTTGTLTLTITDETVTLADGVWPSWTADNGILSVGGTDYAIATRTDDTNIELSEAWAGATVADQDYSLKHNGIFDMAEDFGGLDSNLVHAPGIKKPDVMKISESRIRQLRASDYTIGYPQFVATRVISLSTSATQGQRWQMLFWPLPNAAYTLSFQMIPLLDMVGDDTYYIPGGSQHSETAIASCLDIASQYQPGDAGSKKNYFMERLVSSVNIDQKAKRALYMGRMRNSSVHRPQSERHDDFTIEYIPR